MSDPYKNLTAACGGRINPETLAQFQKAIREYEMFMVELGKMFAPIDTGEESQGAVVLK
jgi:hypothetical protein